MILTRSIFVSACAALAPSKHEQQAVAAGNSSNSFSNKRTWQDAPNEDSKHASPDTERYSVRTPGAQRFQGFLEVAGKGV